MADVIAILAIVIAIWINKADVIANWFYYCVADGITTFCL